MNASRDAILEWLADTFLSHPKKDEFYIRCFGQTTNSSGDTYAGLTRMLRTLPANSEKGISRRLVVDFDPIAHVIIKKELEEEHYVTIPGKPLPTEMEFAYTDAKIVEEKIGKRTIKRIQFEITELPNEKLFLSLDPRDIKRFNKEVLEIFNGTPPDAEKDDEG